MASRISAPCGKAQTDKTLREFRKRCRVWSMNSTRRVRRIVLILLLAGGAVLAARPQIQPSSPQSVAEIKAEEEKLYADAHPYLDEPLPQLKKTVRKLEGLKPAPSQEQLSDLLARVAAKADELLHKMPNVISDEAVAETQWADSRGTVPACIAGCLDPVPSAERNREFNYIILAHPAQEHRLLLGEYRTSRKDEPVQGSEAPHFQGFASLWVLFSSFDQAESRFRYLGEQKTDGHAVFVVGFAQIPGSIEFPAMIVTRRGSIPMLLQGIAWIDQADFRIVRLRADLLAPQPDFGYEKQTSDIQFGPAHIPALGLELWLPRSVNVETEAQGQLWKEQHRYSKYRLYQAKSRIILGPSN